MTETLISKPALLIDFPEVSIIDSDFVYNFFEPDERLNETGEVDGGVGFTSTTVDLTSTTSFTNNIGTSNITESNLKAYYGRSAKYPRFVKISFNSPDITKNFYTSLRPQSDPNLFSREDALNVFGRTGTSVVDTQLDQTIYAILSGAAESVSVSTTESFESASQRLISAILNGIQPDGYRFAQSDERAGVSNSIDKALQGLAFGFSYSSNFIETITDASLNTTKNIYTDEISSIKQSLGNTQEIAIASSNPYAIRTTDYEVNFNFYANDPSSLGASENFSLQKNLLLGYIVQKYGSAEDGTVKIFNEKLILSPNATSFLDPEVAYGRRYRYRIISLYACKFQMNEKVTSTSAFGGGEQDRFVTKYALFASRGVDTSVVCEENIAPPPPVDLKFKYRGDNTGLNITWNFPINLQRDIKKFQIFRRRTTSEPFQLIKVYDFDDSVVKSLDPEQVPARLISRSILPVTLHNDVEFTKNSKFIYAICAIDAHGLTSNYSVQLEATYDRYRNRVNTRVISRSNAPKPYPNIFLNQDTFVDTMKMSGYTRLKVYFNPEYIAVADQNGRDMEHVKFNNSSEDNTYKLMITNTDFQQSQTLDIKINDTYVQPPVITPSTARVFFPQ